MMEISGLLQPFIIIYEEFIFLFHTCVQIFNLGAQITCTQNQSNNVEIALE